MKLGGIRYPYNKTNKKYNCCRIFFFFLNFRKKTSLVFE